MTGGSLQASTQSDVRGTALPQGTATTSTLTSTTIQQSSTSQMTLAYGTASGQVDVIVCQDRTLAATTAETHDLYAGTLKDILGAAVAARKVKYLEVGVVSGGDASGVKVGGAASQAWPGFFGDPTDKVIVYPSGPAYAAGLPAGVAVGATTNNLKIENAGAVPVTYRLVIGATSV